MRSMLLCALLRTSSVQEVSACPDQAKKNCESASIDNSTMTFFSILFQRGEDRSRAQTAQVPSFFYDLNLDQIVDAVTASKEEYNLKPFFYTPLNDIAAITYRYEVWQDLEDPILLKHINSFARKMGSMRAELTQA